MLTACSISAQNMESQSERSNKTSTKNVKTADAQSNEPGSVSTQSMQTAGKLVALDEKIINETGSNVSTESIIDQPATSPDPDFVRPVEPEINLNGRVVTFRGHYATLNNYKREPTGDASNLIDILYNRIQFVQDKFNFKFEFVPEVTSGWRVIDSFNKEALAGKNWADIVLNMSRMAFPTQAINKLVLPLNTVFDFVNDPVYYTIYLRTVTEWEGNIYGLPFERYGQPDLGIFYNKEIIDKMGLTDPMELYNRGDWNWENFFSLAVDATKDINNDGKVDQFGINGDVRRVYEALMASNGTNIVNYSNEDGYTLALEKPAVMRVINKISEIFNSLKIVKQDTFLTVDADNSFKNGKALFIMAGLPGQIGDMKKAGLSQVRWMSLPRGPDNENGNLNIIRESNYYSWTTTIGDDWENVIKASSWLFTPWDYVRYPEVKVINNSDRLIWMESIRQSNIFDEVNIDHIANMIFGKGTIVSKNPAWKPITTIVEDKVLKSICQKASVEQAVNANVVEECNNALNTLLGQ
jgi:hypothetical protein